MALVARLLLVAGLSFSSAGATSPAQAEPRIDHHVPIISYVRFPSLDPVRPLDVAGPLRVPADAVGALPAVVVVHGSAGIDSRGAFYIEALNAAGIATLEIETCGPRAAGSAERPAGRAACPRRCRTPTAR